MIWFTPTGNAAYAALLAENKLVTDPHQLPLLLSIVNLHTCESNEPKEETLGHLLTLFKGLASKQQSYSESSWQGKTSFGIVTSVMVEDLLTETEFSLLELIAMLEIPSTAASLLQQIIHSIIGHTREFDSH